MRDMENHPSKRSLVDYLPNIPRKKRTSRVEVPKMESSAFESPIDRATSDEPHSNDSDEKPKKWVRKPLPKPPILKVYLMPDRLWRKIRGMGGESTTLVMQKQLSYTDLTKNNSRLSIPKGEIIFDFLYKDEEMSLNKYVKHSKRKMGIKVLTIDPSLGEIEMNFKKWEMDKACVYNLTNNWNYLVEKNGLQAGDTIQLWSFRIKQRKIIEGSSLCFALVKLEEEGAVDNGDDEPQSTSVDPPFKIDEHEQARLRDVLFSLPPLKLLFV